MMLVMNSTFTPVPTGHLYCIYSNINQCNKVYFHSNLLLLQPHQTNCSDQSINNQ